MTTVRTEDFEQHFQLMKLVFAGERAQVEDLMRRHVERSLPSAAVEDASSAAADGRASPAAR